MAIFVESPWPILFVGIAVEAVLAFLFVRTGLGKFLIAIIGVAVLIVAGLIVERFVVTDRKLVEQTLDTAVAAVRRNDLQGALDCVSPSAKKARQLPTTVFGWVTFEDAYIRRLEINVNRLSSPPTAEAKFQAFGRARDRRGEIPYQGFSRNVSLELRRENGRWLVTDYRIEGVDKLQP